MQEKHVQPFVQLVFFVILHRLITKFINYDMKKSRILMAFIAVVLFMAPQESSAQSLLQKLGGAVSSLTSSGGSSSSTSGNLVQTVANLLGTIALQSDSLQGTWVYSQPCVAFESENVLTSLGGVAASAKVESTLKSLLQKAGFTEGKVILTFNADSTGVITCGSRNVDVQWSLSGTDLTLTFPTTQKSVKMNAKVTGGTLQVAMNAEKLLTVVTTVTEKTSSLSTTMSTLNSLLKNVNGLYLGLKYTRKE